MSCLFETDSHPLTVMWINGSRREDIQDIQGITEDINYSLHLLQTHGTYSHQTHSESCRQTQHPLQHAARIQKKIVMRDSTSGVHRRCHTESWQWTTVRLPHHGLLKGIWQSNPHPPNPQYGIKGKTNAWIKGFLSDRTQRVVIEGEKSDII